MKKIIVSLILVALFAAPVAAAGWTVYETNSPWGGKIELHVSPDIQKEFFVTAKVMKTPDSGTRIDLFLFSRKEYLISANRDFEAPTDALTGAPGYDPKSKTYKRIQGAFYDLSGAKYFPNGKNVKMFTSQRDPRRMPDRKHYQEAFGASFYLYGHKPTMLKVWIGDPK